MTKDHDVDSAVLYMKDDEDGDDSPNPQAPNYMFIVHQELSGMLCDKLVTKLNATTARLVGDIRGWLLGKLSLHEICLHNEDHGQKIKQFSVDNLIHLIFTTSHIFEDSHDENELRFSALLKRLGKYLNGGIALKDL